MTQDEIKEMLKSGKVEALHEAGISLTKEHAILLLSQGFEMADIFEYNVDYFDGIDQEVCEMYFDVKCPCCKSEETFGEIIAACNSKLDKNFFQRLMDLRYFSIILNNREKFSCKICLDGDFANKMIESGNGSILIINERVFKNLVWNTEMICRAIDAMGLWKIKGKYMLEFLRKYKKYSANSQVADALKKNAYIDLVRAAKDLFIEELPSRDYAIDCIKKGQFEWVIENKSSLPNDILDGDIARLLIDTDQDYKLFMYADHFNPDVFNESLSDYILKKEEVSGGYFKNIHRFKGVELNSELALKIIRHCGAARLMMNIHCFPPLSKEVLQEVFNWPFWAWHACIKPKNFIDFKPTKRRFEYLIDVGMGKKAIESLNAFHDLEKNQETLSYILLAEGRARQKGCDMRYRDDCSAWDLLWERAFDKGSSIQQFNDINEEFLIRHRIKTPSLI